MLKFKYIAIVLMSLMLSLSCLKAEAKTHINFNIITGGGMMPQPLYRPGHWKCISYNPWGNCMQYAWKGPRFIQPIVYYGPGPFFGPVYYSRHHRI